MDAFPAAVLTALHTPLYEKHVAANASFVEFGGWEMPLLYDGILEEHLAVRRDAGLFDVSHMGKILVSGPTAWDFIQGLSANTIPQKAFRARYTHLLDEDGHIIDDVIVTCLAPDRFFVVCNAAPRERVLAWFRTRARGEHIEDLTAGYLCLALQGPKAARILQLMTSVDLGVLKSFGAAYCDMLLGERVGTSRPPPSVPLETEGWGSLGDVCLVTRTGYTGEDGFELYPPRAIGPAVWDALLVAGGPSGLRRVGLGARDTLRLEKGFLLSGTDFDGRQSSLEASCEWLVKWDHAFVGREPMLRQKERGDYDRLVGLLLQERGIPRHGCAVVRDGREVGRVTSGSSSPLLKKGIALAYVRPDAAAEGTELGVVVRDRPLRAIVKKPPFV